MASIRKYKTAKGYAWRVQYRSPDGRGRTKQGFRTKAEAEAWSAKNATDIHAGQWRAPTKTAITVGELGDRWLAMQTHLKPSTMRTTEQSWRVHVRPKWGDVSIMGVRPSDVQEWVAGIDRAAATVRHAHACLAQVLDLAVLDGLLKANPARGVRLPRRAKSKKVYLTVEQVQFLVDQCSRYQELVWVLATTGLRWGEAVALRVCDVNEARGRLSITRNAVTVGYEVHVGTPKNHERRTVAVPRRVMQMLVPLMEGKARDALLWPRESDGGFMRVPGYDGWFYGAVQRAMGADADFPWVTPHGLRHVAAGLMVASGASVKVVQRQLGHASAAMTLDVYADLFDGDLDEVARAMDGVLQASWDCRGA